jgi:stage IV sporulation protein FB
MKRTLTFSIHPLFWLFAALIGFLWSHSLVGTILWVFIILISVSVHELGHALTGMAFKQNVHIQLMMFGGMTSRQGPKLKLWKEFILTLNGPLAGYALGAVALGVLYLWPTAPVYVLMILRGTVMVNFFWSTVNLFPILPLDGGHLLRIILEAIFGARGTSIALLVGVILGAMVTIACFVVGFLIAGAIFFLLTFESFRSWRSFRHMAESDRDEDLQQLAREGEIARQMGNRDEAAAKLEQVRQRTRKGLLHVVATEGLAHLLSEQGEDEKAYEYLKEVRKHLSPQSLPLFQRLAYAHGDYEQVVALGKEVFQLNPHYKVAWMTALAHASRGEVRPAIGWIECAIREGLPDADQALHDAQLDPIRQDPKFQEFTHNLDLDSLDSES